MSKKNSLAKAPYSEAGDLLDYVGYGDAYEWRDNKPFPALMTLDGTERGRSAARFVWHGGKGGATFKMFMTDMVDLVQSDNNLFRGTADIWWMVQKRGQNYGIRRATDDDLREAGHTAGPREDCPACEGIAYRYMDWCPLTPTAEELHQFRQAPMTHTVRCLCGEGMNHAAHGLT